MEIGKSVSRYTGSPGRALRVVTALCSTKGRRVPAGTTRVSGVFWATVLARGESCVAVMKRRICGAQEPAASATPLRLKYRRRGHRIFRVANTVAKTSPETWCASRYAPTLGAAHAVTTRNARPAIPCISKRFFRFHSKAAFSSRRHLCAGEIQEARRPGKVKGVGEIRMRLNS